MVTTIVPCKECHEHPCTCEEETGVEENNKDEGEQLEYNDTDQIIHRNTILCSLHTLALVRCAL